MVNEANLIKTRGAHDRRLPRVLFVATVASMIRAFLLPFAAHFRAKGWRVDAAAEGISTDRECCSTFDNVTDIDWKRNPLNPNNLIGPPRTIQNLVERNGYQIVHVHSPIASFVTRYALRNVRRSGHTHVIYTAHGFHFHPQGSRLDNCLFRFCEKMAGYWTDYLVVMNGVDLEAARLLGTIEHNRIWYMPGIGLDCDYYDRAQVSQQSINALRAELGLTSDQQVITMVAEFTPRKLHVDLLRAFSRLRLPNARLLLAGTGPTERHARELASELGIQERVRFLGFRRDIRTLLSITNVSALCSSQEGLPRAVLEALAMGVPIAGTDIRGTRDLIDSTNGQLVPVGDVGALASTLGSLLRNGEKAKELGQRGRERAREYDLSRVIALHENLYATALADAASYRAPAPIGGPTAIRRGKADREQMGASN